MSTASPAMQQLLAEAAWLRAHPEFSERPATIKEFLGERYLNIYDKVRPGVRGALVDIFGKEVDPTRISADYERAMLTGAIGIGKTTFASIALPYMAHWVLCLSDPQEFFGLLPGSRIAFMQMSTSEQNAREVVFGDIFARIDHSAWFKKYPRDPKFTKQIRFTQKDIWILPGDSLDTTFEGYNILGGIIDEMDSHRVTKEKDYAEDGYNTIESRISSRFVDEVNGGHKGLLILIGQMKKSHGFAARKYKEFLDDPKAHVTRMSIWESLGWNKFLDKSGNHDSFWYDPKRKQVIPKEFVPLLEDKDHLIEVPNAYVKNFVNNPVKALKDLAGIPPNVEDAFINLEDRVNSCVDRWVEHHKGSESPVDTNPRRPQFAEWFKANGDPRKRVMHIDLATSGDGDALGMAMGHVSEMITDDNDERKPYIVIDFLMRIKVPSGSEILLSDVRKYIYDVRDELGFRLVEVTLDGFNSIDTMQQLRKKKFSASYLSVDRNTLPYEDLRDAIYEQRIEFPRYMTYLNAGDYETVQITVRELLALQDTGKKIDHPPKGSKDVADALAGVTSTLMGDRTYHRGLGSNTRTQNQPTAKPFVGPNIRQPNAGVAALNRVGGLSPLAGNPFEITIPRRLQRRG